MPTNGDRLAAARNCLATGQLDQAQVELQMLLRARPHDPEALFLQGAVARRAGRLNLAVELLRQAIHYDSHSAPFHLELGIALHQSGHLEAALSSFQRATQLDPTLPDAWTNRGAVLERLDRLAEALPAFEQAAQLDPNCAVSQFNLGNALLSEGRFEQAISRFDRALELRPELAKARWNRGLCHLALGQYAPGWLDYGWRRQAGEVVIDSYPQPRWQGEPLAGKSIVCHAEQGIGDEIFFASCLPDLLAAAARVVVVCDPRLVGLYERSFPQARFIGYQRRKDRRPADLPHPVDFQTPLGDLPRFFRTDLKSFPSRESFLRADPAAVEVWRSRFAPLGRRLKVGISWRAGGQPTERRRRTTSLSDWLPLFDPRSVALINIQYGETAAELAQAAESGLEIHDWPAGDPLVHFDDFAAKLSALDLVISVGNSTVHLAGALGVPTWTLLPRVPAWRWGASGEHSPWYPNVRCFRQSDVGWSDVFAQVATRLHELASRQPYFDLHPSRQLAKNSSTSQPKSLPAPLPNSQPNTPTPSPELILPPSADKHLPTLALLEAAERTRAAGDLETAESLCNQILMHTPRHPQALLCLSRIAQATHRTDLAVRSLERAVSIAGPDDSLLRELADTHLAAGQVEKAIDALRQAVARCPNSRQSHFALANAYRSLGQFASAQDHYLRAKELWPDNPKVFNYLGANCLELKDFAAAESAFARAVELAPGYFAALNNLGLARRELGQISAARECFEQALALDPSCTQALTNLASLDERLPQSPFRPAGASPPTPDRNPSSLALPHPVRVHLETAAVHFNAERYSAAAAAAQPVLDFDPSHPIALRIHGVQARRAKRLDDSLAAFRQALGRDPRNFALWFEMGVTYIEQHEHQAAYDCFLKVLECRPGFQPAFVNLSGLMEQQERYADSTHWAEQAVAVHPNCALAEYNLANALREQGRIEEAMVHYHRALELNPQYVKADWNLGICYLHLGQYEEGWRRYELRQAADEVQLDRFTEPRWDGASLAGKTIVVHAEQGLGDEIVFASCLPDLIPLAKRCIVLCDLRLEKLFRRSFPQATVHGYARRKDWAPMPLSEPFDVQTPIGSLPLHLRPNRESFPRRERFLTVDPALLEQWRERFAALGPGLKVGISWRAGGKPLERRKRSIPLEAWGPVLNTPHVHFINLQYGDASADVDAVYDEFGVTLHDFEQGDPLVDVDSFAAKIAALDLVISVGNATVHMAGAVGTPAWTLLPMIPSWRWAIRGDESPWYRTVRLFRQTTRNDWPPVLERLGKMLGELALQPGADPRQMALTIQPPPAPLSPPVPTPPLSEHRWLDSSQFSANAAVEAIPDTIRQGDEALLAGDLATAESLFRSVLQIAPRFPSALQGLSRVARRQGKYELAIRSIKRALATADHAAVRRCDLAGALADAGRPDEAIASYRRAIELDPNLLQARLELGQLLRQLGRLDQAQTELQRAVELAPHNETALIALGDLRLEDQSAAEAAELFRRAAAAAPASPLGPRRLSAALHALSQPDEAAAALRQALERDPGSYDLVIELASQLGELGDPAEAQALYRRALTLRPPQRELLNSLGVVLADQGRLEESLHCYSEALRLSGQRPYPLAHANRAFALLQLGRYFEGWQDYEWRWSCPGSPPPRTHLPQPLWDGSSLDGKTILVHGEQGPGDEIMFATCYPDLIERARHVVIACEPRLEKLFRRSFPAASVIAVLRGAEHRWLPPAKLGIDLQIPAGSLPLHLRNSRDAFPRQKQSLVPDAPAVARWRERLQSLGAGLKVGISWRAGDKPKDRRTRSTRLADWRPLLETPGVQFINLQYGDCSAELAEFTSITGRRIHDWPDADNRNNLDGLAAKIAPLDLVIAVGSTTVHLAGAVGAPCWCLLPCHGGWRWLAGEQDTPWYDSVKLFRQPAPGDWPGLLALVREALLANLDSRGDSTRLGAFAPPHWARRDLRSPSQPALSSKG